MTDINLECFPTSAWRSSGLEPLPGKSRRPLLEPYQSALAVADVPTVYVTPGVVAQVKGAGVGQMQIALRGVPGGTKRNKVRVIRAKDHRSAALVNVSAAVSEWPVVRCRSMAGSGCPPRGQSLGEPDPFRLRHRDALRAVVSEVVRERLDRRAAAARIEAWAAVHIDEGDRTAFRDVAETELPGLHEGNFARYAIRPGEFTVWHQVWTPRSS